MVKRLISIEKAKGEGVQKNRLGFKDETRFLETSGREQRTSSRSHSFISSLVPQSLHRGGGGGGGGFKAITANVYRIRRTDWTILRLDQHLARSPVLVPSLCGPRILHKIIEKYKTIISEEFYLG